MCAYAYLVLITVFVGILGINAMISLLAGLQLGLVMVLGLSVCLALVCCRLLLTYGKKLADDTCYYRAMWKKKNDR
ncbi:hypothetical protein GGG87_04885 [Streptococcus sp. zg-86]|uniref:Uncharacterized protein n=1 Tax=Streptococcus zhangguiae TaxID=2664091 RepID=A0A6I4R9B4_9STRE|nr:MULTISPECIES: hypothetical protein [unclassified Streptococcus]MTB64329.1 hypothetical protein [Streptococcus sp. zg-86]MTB90639.1 hypothetical protein [Streptococcus sp. zg-36]MWV56366.1 hypothetical protein [Streptococcus sp. zg-70]QTH47422.1 hypothetical protein J5M87_07650 [Streptococcus sp. zg-86]